MILENSRYADNDVQSIDGVPTVLPSRTSVRSFIYTDYTCTVGDRIDLLAARFLGSPTDWWKIADANPEWTLYSVLPPGLVLRIPSGVR